MRLLTYSAILLLQVLALFSPAHAAPRFEDRKPINSGMWFDPSRSGEGFELRAVRDEVFVVWFAYDDQGKPVWYTAQGLLKTGEETRYPLQKYRFQNGRASPEVAGELVFKNVTSTRISVAFTLGANSGTRSLLQLEASANAAEIDHSGQWYQRTKSGYGLGLSESENAGIAVLYMYDANGAPMWLFGGRSDAKTADYPLFYYTGSCPSCVYNRPTTRAAGLLKVAFPSADSLVASIQAPDAGADFQLNQVPLTRLTPVASALAANRSLVAAPDAASLQRELFEASKTLFPVYTRPGIDFSAGSPIATGRFSTPNLIAQNVDEAISLRTDGDFVYAISAAQTEVRVLKYQASELALVREINLQLPVTRLDAAGRSLVPPRITSELNGLTLYNDALIVTRGSSTTSYPVGEFSFLPPPGLFENGRVLVEFTKKNVVSPPRSIEIEGVLLATRRIDNRLYILSRSTINPYAGIVGATLAERTAQVQALPVEKFLPSLWVNGVQRPALSAPNVYSPPVGVPPGNQYILLTQIDLDKTLEAPGTIKSTAMLGQLTSFYFSERNLTIATNRFFYGSAAFENFRSLQRPYSTELHRFSLNTSGVEYIASGSVDGVLDLSVDRAAQRFGEKQNELRVVTTSNGQVGATSPNRLTILAPSTITPSLLKTVSTLPNASQPAPIGKPGESLFGTRFVGDRLYAVTFRRTDPLYVIDLQDSAKPFIAGELEIPGFSNYLYPVGSSYLLGVGYDAQQSGQQTIIGGLQFSLFDVSNASRPTRVSNIILGNSGSSSALFSSHLALSAISISANQTHFALPASVRFADNTQNYSGLLQLEISHGSNPSMTLNTPLKPAIVDSAQTSAAITAANLSARGLYLRDLRVYLENGRVWYQRGDQVFGPL